MRRKDWAAALALGAGATFVLLGNASAQVATGPIAFVGDDDLSVAIKDGTGKATVIVVNEGPEKTIDWKIDLVTAADGTKRTATVEPAQSTLAERSSQIVPLAIKNVSATGKLTGVLIGTPTASGAPITRALTLSNFGFWLALDPPTIVAAALILSIAVVTLRYVTLPAKYTGPLSNPKWSFTTSWASTFTGAGAVLATLVSAGALPDSPYLLEKSEFALLAVFFGAIGLVAPVVFLALNGNRAPIFVFHVATWLTTAGVVGQLTTVVLLLVDALGQGAGSLLVLVLGAVELVGVALILVYIVRGIPRTLDEARAAAGVAENVGRRPATWSLL